MNLEIKQEIASLKQGPHSPRAGAVKMTDQTDATDTPDTLGKFHRHQRVEARADVTDHWEEAIVIGHAWGTDRYDVLLATGKQIDNTTQVREAP